MQDKVKFAVVGCGRIGKRHAAVIQKTDGAELVALCDVLGKEGLDLDNYAVPFYNSLEELLNSGIAIDAACVATPNGLHAANALQVLRAGNHVVIEKPMALRKKDCEEILSEASKQNKQVFCVMQNRFSPQAVWLKRLLEEKVLGDIYIVQINAFWNRDERYYNGKTWHGSKEMDGGTLFTQFAHFIDMIYWLFGDIKNINSRFFNFNHRGITDFEDSGFIQFDLINGGSGSMNYSTAVWEKNLESSITVIAQNGTVKLGGQYMNELLVCNIKGCLVPQSDQQKGENKEPGYHYRLFFEHIVSDLKGATTSQFNLSDGVKVVELVERIYMAS